MAGEAVWISGGRLPVTVRFAVHAVRRIEGATVLDWSVTPLRRRAASSSGTSSARHRPGPVPRRRAATSTSPCSTRLTDQVYRPLSHASRRLFNHCLCTPLWVIQQALRIGETRLLQIAYPELPATLAYVDVSLASWPPSSTSR